MSLSGYGGIPGAPGNPNMFNKQSIAQRVYGPYDERFTPLATTGGGMAPMGNAGFFLGPQYGQELQGYGGKYVS